MKKEFYICSKRVIESFPECEKSAPIKTGYKDDDPCFIAVLDFDKVKSKYDSLTDEEQNDFCCWEIVPGTMDVSKITLTGIKRDGLFCEIERVTGLTNLDNRAMCIHELCEKFRVSPIDFAKKITR